MQLNPKNTNMSTVRVGETIEAPLGGLGATFEKPIELPDSMDTIEFILCLLLGATILRCFYACICRPKSKDKAA